MCGIGKTKFENVPQARAVYNHKRTQEIFCRTNAATQFMSDFCKEEHNISWHAELYTFVTENP